jgi:hypothetical protein
MKKLKTFLLALIIAITSVMCVNISAQTEEIYPETYIDENYTELKGGIIRELIEESFNAFMPDIWFFERGHVYFEKYLAIQFVDGYEYNSNDFEGLGIIEVTDDFGLYIDRYSKSIQNDNVKCVVFDSYDSIQENITTIENNDNIVGILGGGGIVALMVESFPIEEDIAEYLTPAEIQENAEIIEKELAITVNGDLDGDYETTMTDTVLYLKQIATQKPLNSVEFYRADMHQDGKVDVVDLVTCVYKILEN